MLYPAELPDYQHRRDYGATEQIPVLLDDRMIGHLPVHDLLP